MNPDLEKIVEEYISSGKEFTVGMVANDFYGDYHGMDDYAVTRAKNRVRQYLNSLNRKGIVSKSRIGRGVTESIYCKSEYGSFESSNMRVRNALKNSPNPMRLGDLYVAAFPNAEKITGEMALSVRTYLRQLAILGKAEMISEAWDYRSMTHYCWKWVNGQE
jgi:hypothetical protein